MLEPSVLKGCLREHGRRVTTRSPDRVRRAWAFVVPLLLHAGCAAAPQPAPEAAAPALAAPEPEPAPLPTLNLTELEALEHDLSVSEARLDEELARRAAAGEDATESASELPAAEPAEPQKAADSAGSGQAGGPARPARRPAPKPATGAEPGKLGSPCDLGCRALASMQRAQLRICEIVGPNERCQRATERVQAAVERVRAGGCECRAEDR